MKNFFFKVVFLLVVLATAFSSCKTDEPNQPNNTEVHTSIFDKGDGTQLNPFIITTPEQLDSVRNNLSAYYKLGNNIDLTSYLTSGGAGYNNGAGWDPLGFQINPLRGSFDGAGYKITGLWINRSSEDAVGLFSFMANGSVQNLAVEIANNNGGVKGHDQVGGLVGAMAQSNVTNCCIIGMGTINGNDNVGGMVGNAGWGGNTIANCYSTIVVNGSEYVGSLSGVLNGDGNIIANCYTSGTVNGNKDVGGIVGRVNISTITNCYATGSVNGADIYVGGVAGGVSTGGKVFTCYSIGKVNGNNYVGGVAGVIFDNSYTTNCVALNPNVTGNNNYVGRVVGYVQNSSLGNNWARNDMTITANGSSKTLSTGNDMVDGVDCAAIPAASWWTSVSPNGPGWSSSVWYFANEQLPIFQ